MKAYVIWDKSSIKVESKKNEVRLKVHPKKLFTETDEILKSFSLLSLLQHDLSGTSPKSTCWNFEKI